MAHDPKKAALLVLARMAASDGQVDSSERALLADLADIDPNGPDIDALLLEAQKGTLEDLLAGLSRYEDRFFVALRAYMMARIDAHFDVAEEAFYNRLIDSLEITSEDRALITETQQRIFRNQEEPDPRISELYQRSSFFAEETS